MPSVSRQRGFTLVELMVTVAIVGILAAIAVPAYNEYAIKARVTELINASSAAKMAVAEYRITNGVMPTNAASAGITSLKTSYISKLTVNANGRITITGNKKALGTGSSLTIRLTPTYSNGAVTWTCTSTGAKQYAPSTCQ